MTQAAPSQLDQFTAFIEKVDKKLEVISADIVEIKLSQIRTEERLSALEQSIDQRFSALEQSIDQRFSALEQSVDQRFSALEQSVDQRFNALEQSIDQRFSATNQRLDSLEERFKTQDNRTWGLIAGVVLALFGLLAKMAFFPSTPL